MEKLYRLYGKLTCIPCIHLPTTFSLLFFTLLTAIGYAQVNAYAKVTGITTTAGKSVLAIKNVNQSKHTFAVGEDVIVIQMQDDIIGGTGDDASFGSLSLIKNAGFYEVATISALTPSPTPTSMTLNTALGHSYTFGNNSSVQVVSFTKLTDPAPIGTTNYTTTGTITAIAWDGNLGTGGVVAFQVPGTLTLKNSVTADGKGFAGGAASGNYTGITCEPSVYTTSSSHYGAKGEGIYLITDPAYVRGRARVLSGGGGGSYYAGGGGGGSNYSAGGDAGSHFLCSETNGLGGIAFGSNLSTGTRLFMGGGGGGGQGNGGAQTAGANGGGIVIIKAGTLTTNCSSARISANGNDADNAGGDGAGGGGAAGTILLQVTNYNLSCQLNVQANGGDGGDGGGFFSYGGGGGGGGQGAILFAGSLPGSRVNATTVPGSGGSNGFLAGSGGSGTGSNNAGIVTGIGIVLPVRLVYFSAENKNNQAVLNWTSADESGVTYNVQHSTDGISFTTIGTVKGTGNGSGTTNYTFTDPNLVNGRNFYRLEMTGSSLTSKTIYSSIAYVNLSELVSNIPVAYPNPAHGHFYIRISGENSNKTYVVTVTDLTGKVVYTTSGKPANNIITVTPSKNLKPGLYMFKVAGSDGAEQTGKLIMQ